MTEKISEKESFINRKRPALESIVEDLLGPATQMDELISSNPLPPEINHDRNEERLPEEKGESS